MYGWRELLKAEWVSYTYIISYRALLFAEFVFLLAFIIEIRCSLLDVKNITFH